MDGRLSLHPSPLAGVPSEPVRLSWLTRVRWTTIVAGAGAVVASRTALDVGLGVRGLVAVFVPWIVSNLWLMARVRRDGPAPVGFAGSLVVIDVVVLTGLLLVSGGTLNPANVFYLVQIVMAALVLGPRWTWTVTALSVGGYASLYALPSTELSAAVVMHREIGLHMRGMWLAFALTALIIAVLVTRLAVAVERRDRALESLREQSARATRAAGLATLAAGAAHELSTPLSTIAVSARELEHRLAAAGAATDLSDDARTIREETDRCRRVLEEMAGQAGQPRGAAPRAMTVADVVSAMSERLSPVDRARLDTSGVQTLPVVWPLDVVTRALGNVVHNACHASAESARVIVAAAATGAASITLTVLDHGRGMSVDTIARAGEPFFTTKPAGQGTGLGLFVARSSVEQLGGALAIASELNRGTTVTLTLPRNVLEGR